MLTALDFIKLLFGLRNPQTQLTSDQMAIVRTIQALFIGSLTTAVIAVFVNFNAGTFTVPVLLLGFLKTFLDAFGHGIAKYVRTSGNDPAAEIIDQTTDTTEKKINVGDFDTQSGNVRNIPHQNK